jgi:hypothetical protein
LSFNTWKCQKIFDYFIRENAENMRKDRRKFIRATIYPQPAQQLKKRKENSLDVYDP